MVDAVDAETNEPSHAVLIADVGVAEAAAAFAVLQRVGRIRRSVRDGAYDRLMTDVGLRYQLVHAGTDDFFAAAALTQHHPLKAYDAVQLAVALRSQQALAAGGLSLVFVSGDRTLLTAAQAEGLTTDNPFDHVDPQDAP